MLEWTLKLGLQNFNQKKKNTNEDTNVLVNNHKSEYASLTRTPESGNSPHSEQVFDDKLRSRHLFQN